MTTLGLEGGFLANWLVWAGPVSSLENFKVVRARRAVDRPPTTALPRVRATEGPGGMAGSARRLPPPRVLVEQGVEEVTCVFIL